jgi:hypothetical protein
MSLLQGLVLAFGINHLILGMFWLPTYQHAPPVLLAFGLYLLALIFSIYGHSELRIPSYQAWSNLAVAVTVPVLVLSQLPIADYAVDGSFQTWFVAGISLILSITTARGHAAIAWIGLAALWAEVLIWGGVPVLTTSGLIGALLLVAASWGVGRGLRSTEKSAREFHKLAAELESRTSRTVAVREARQRLLQGTLLTAMPMLELIRDSKGDLSEGARAESVLLSSRLRDEIQGNRILNDGVRLATREARKRGVDVSFDDQGGLDQLEGSELLAIQSSITQAINATEAGKIHIAAPAGQSYAVSIVASRPEAGAPDLWLRLP